MEEDELNLSVPGGLDAGRGDREITFIDASETEEVFFSRLFPKVEKIGFDKFEAELTDLQGHLAAIFAKISGGEDPNGFHLDEVSVSLAVHADGSIGIAAAGVEASIGLTYKPS